MRSTGNVKSACIVAAFFVAVTASSAAQTFTYKAFNGKNGGNPQVPPVQGLNGNLFGTTGGGGAYGYGTVYEQQADGKLTTLYSFCSQANCADGAYPYGLVLAANGNFYGTTGGGGANSNSAICKTGCGTVFEITPAGKFTSLYSFCAQASCSDGAVPFGTLAQGVNGNFYGTTFQGGNCGGLCGTIFEITAAGKLSTLYSFCPGETTCPDGDQPVAGLVLGTDGNFYGTAGFGGLNSYQVSSGYGTAFKISPQGHYTTMHQFCSLSECEDGWYPKAGLVQGADGNFYGVTYGGGAYDQGVLWRFSRDGAFDVLYTFCQGTTGCANTDGNDPSSPLIQAQDGNFYSTTYQGGANTAGVVFEYSLTGGVSVLYSFCSVEPYCKDGEGPTSGLMEATDGTLYGTVVDGGPAHNGCFSGGSCGTLYSLATGLGPFVESNPVFGKAGYTINILGNNLTGTTSVTFNGVAAEFTVVSGAYIKATVPSGATTGTISVVTPTATLNSNVAFQVVE